MKKKAPGAALLAIALVFVAFPFLAFGAPPPDEVDEILGQLGKFEESFEAENWNEAMAVLGVLSGEVRGMLEHSARKDEYLEKSLDDLSKYVIEQNEQQAEAQYIRFQKQFFEFISQFDYKVHPLLDMIQTSVLDESSQAYADKDYEDVVREMREAGNLIEQARPLLVERGIQDVEINEFKSRVIELIMAGRKEDYQKMGVLLDQIRERYASFMTRYHQ